MEQYKVLTSVPSIGFYGATGDERFPEDFPLAAAMTSLMQYLKEEDFPVIEHKNATKCILERRGNQEFMAASAMAFGLLWSGEFSTGAMDFARINPLEQELQYVFDWAGYEFEIIRRAPDGDNTSRVQDRIVKAIQNGMPLLGFGFMHFPECSLLTGYDRGGDVAVGWGYRQFDAEWALEDNGMFRDGDWHKNWLAIVIPGRKIGRRGTFLDVIDHGVDAMLRRQSGAYRCGIAAYDGWIEWLEKDHFDRIGEFELCKQHEVHHALAGSLAEARWWGRSFLLRHSKHPEIVAAADCFKEIHDLCWQIWKTLSEPTGKALHLQLRDKKKRQLLISLLSRCRAADMEAVTKLQNALRPR